ncbi:MAG: glycosyltransferase [Oscillospiraceae bacterium]|nr:glycosyltransferase [Oscillospiraceae bacterium]
MPLISVIVPVYRVEAYLDKCIASITDQTYRKLEIILVDDGSPDNCPAMCDAWAERDSRIKVIHKLNGGLSDARNAGMAIASGELLGFVDSDDWIHPDMYRLLYDTMRETESDIAACGVEMVWEDGTPSRMLTASGCAVLNREEAMRALIEESWLKQPVWYKLYKTALVKDIPFPAGKCHEDVFWSYRAVARVERMSVSDRVGYYYLQRGASIMGEEYSIRRLDALEARTQRLEFIRREFPQLLPIEQRSLLFFCMYSMQMAMRCLSKEDLAVASRMIRDVLEEHGLLYISAELPPKQRIWVYLARVTFDGACRIRNTCGIGL